MDALPFLASTLATASVYAVMAVAVVIVYRSNHVLMFHVGELGVLAAYVAATLAGASTGSLGVAVLAGLAAVAASGWVSHAVIDRAAGHLGHFVGTVLTIALGIALMGILSLVWSGQSMRLALLPGSWTIAELSIPRNLILVTLLNTAALVTVLVLIQRSSLGIGMRAVANDARLATLRNIPVQRVLASSWVLASGLAGLGGITMASLSSVAMEGALVGVSGIVAALLGGMTQLRGAVIGALLIAFVQNLVIAFFDARYGLAVPIVFLLVVLSVRPYGLSGRAEAITRV